MGHEMMCLSFFGSLKLLQGIQIIILKMTLIQMLPGSQLQGIIDAPKHGNVIGKGYHYTQNRAQPRLFQSEDSLLVKLRSMNYSKFEAIPKKSSNPNKTNV